MADQLIRHLKNTYPSWEPSVIVDIGANVGEWSRNARKAWPGSKIVMMEASPVHETVLSNVERELGNAKSIMGVLSSQAGETVSFYQTGTHLHTGNSMFKEDTVIYKDIQPVQRITSTLDHILKNVSTSFLHTDTNNDAIDFIKVDVQGAELNVLMGGIETLRQASFLQFEASTVEYNLGGSCHFEVDDFLRSQGYYIYELGDSMHNEELFKTKGLGQWDILYVRPNSARLPAEFQRLAGNYCGSRPDRKQIHSFHSDSTSSSSFSSLPAPIMMTSPSWWSGVLFGMTLVLVFMHVGRFFPKTFSRKNRTLP